MHFGPVQGSVIGHTLSLQRTFAVKLTEPCSQMNSNGTAVPFNPCLKILHSWSSMRQLKSLRHTDHWKGAPSLCPMHWYYRYFWIIPNVHVVSKKQSVAFFSETPCTSLSRQSYQMYLVQINSYFVIFQCRLHGLNRTECTPCAQYKCTQYGRLGLLNKWLSYSRSICKRPRRSTHFRQIHNNYWVNDMPTFIWLDHLSSMLYWVTQAKWLFLILLGGEMAFCVKWTTVVLLSL